MSAKISDAPDTHVGVFLARVRRLCISLPETSETSSWGHPNFRAGKRTFVTIERIGNERSIAFYLSPLEVEELLAQPGFIRTPYGRDRWMSLKTRPRPNWSIVKALVLRSYMRVALKRMLSQLGSTGTARN